MKVINIMVEDKLHCTVHPFFHSEDVRVIM
jgi:hypothetical protein